MADHPTPCMSAADTFRGAPVTPEEARALLVGINDETWTDCVLSGGGPAREWRGLLRPWMTVGSISTRLHVLPENVWNALAPEVRAIIAAAPLLARAVASTPSPSPFTTRRDDADALLAAELRYRDALRTRSGVTDAHHELQRVRSALGLRTHLP